MRASDEHNVDLLRTKARVLESENERLSKRIAAVLRENLALKGMSPEAIELSLPGLLEQVICPHRFVDDNQDRAEGPRTDGAAEAPGGRCAFRLNVNTQIGPS